ncbi:DUF3486 family protein [Citrobacter portucalensis]|uniref:DUF3486 family protein n=1 Tax=Citrobacter portucalensis TaxID=1639133 RepID=UPI00226B33B8|nr:DUF3486 family protein [Citrobacter portucalensis]MCX9038494.1 DUF3486 family protein [Citrobacter portucalensis]
MPPRGKIESLPEDTRRWLERALTENGFSGYRELEALLQEKGYFIGRNTINRYGQKLERRMAAIKASTEAAKLIAETARDDQDSRSEAVIALIQGEMLDTIITLQEANEEEVDPADRVALLSKAAKNMATLTRASIVQKRHADDVRRAAREELQREQAAALEQVAKSQGLGEDQVRFWREKVLGIR